MGAHVKNELEGSHQISTFMLVDNSWILSNKKNAEQTDGRAGGKKWNDGTWNLGRPVCGLLAPMQETGHGYRNGGRKALTTVPRRVQDPGALVQSRQENADQHGKKSRAPAKPGEETRRYDEKMCREQSIARGCLPDVLFSVPEAGTGVGARQRWTRSKDGKRRIYEYP